MRLSDYAHSRDNNFNLMRILAAFAVLFTHSFAIVSGSGDTEPFRSQLGMTMGSMAVDVFFVASGFLVTASLLSRVSLVDYLWARILRIYPGLIVMLLITVFGLGLHFTSLPTVTYLKDPATWAYLADCVTLVRGISYKLPGVFEGTPYKAVVNGSLWTMTFEIRMYLILGLLWYAVGVRPQLRSRLFEVSTVSLALLAGIFIITNPIHGQAKGDFSKLFFMFFTGAAFYIERIRIVLSHRLFIVFLTVLISTALVYQDGFYFAYTSTIAYLVLYLAYVPAGVIRKYNSLGDYSYGLYIYAFPVQQTVITLLPRVSVMEMICISAVATLSLAVLSWYAVEKRALELKGLYIGHTRRLLASLVSHS